MWRRTFVPLLAMLASAVACRSLMTPGAQGEPPCDGQRMVKVTNPSTVPLEFLANGRSLGTVEPRATLVVPDDGSAYSLRPVGVRRSLARPGEAWIWDENMRASLIQRICER